MEKHVAEVIDSIRQLQAELEDLAVGGLRQVGPEHVPLLDHFCDYMQGVGAQHIGERIQVLANAIRQNDKTAASALMRLQASLRLFERILTVNVVTNQLAAMA